MELKKSRAKKTLIKKCHVCHHLNESLAELEKCKGCKKSFLPSNYFNKVHNKNSKITFSSLFEQAEDIQEEILVKGVHVIW